VESRIFNTTLRMLAGLGEDPQMKRQPQSKESLRTTKPLPGILWRIERHSLPFFAPPASPQHVPANPKLSRSTLDRNHHSPERLSVSLMHPPLPRLWYAEMAQLCLHVTRLAVLPTAISPPNVGSLFSTWTSSRILPLPTLSLRYPPNFPQSSLSCQIRHFDSPFGIG
jgi:hypothetical protein